MSAETGNALSAALTAHLADEGFIEPDEFVGDWVTNVHLPSIGDDGGSSYVTVVSGGSLPDHVAQGLLMEALDRLRGIGINSDAD